MPRGRPPKGKGSESSSTKDSKKNKPVSKKDVEEGDEDDVEMLEEEDEDIGSNKKMDADDSVPPALPVSSKTNRKIIFTQQGIVDIGWENIEQVTLNHPSTDRKSLFLIDTRIPSSNNDEEKESSSSLAPFIFEVMTMEQDTRSWFIGDSVVSDGNLYICTPIDPLFLILPALMKTTRAMPLKDHLIETIKDSKVIDVIFARLSASGQLANISKKIVCDDIIAYKFLEDKTLEWLRFKVKKAAECLKEKDITGSEASVSSNFTKSSTATSSEKKQEEYMRYACEIIGEYLPETLKIKLFESLGLPFAQEKILNKRKSELDAADPSSADSSQNTKKLKVADVNIKGLVVGEGESIQPTEDYGSSNPSNLINVNSKMTTKDKELKKAAKGTPSLFKFFAPKTK